MIREVSADWVEVEQEDQTELFKLSKAYDIILEEDVIRIFLDVYPESSSEVTLSYDDAPKALADYRRLKDLISHIGAPKAQ